MADGAAAPWQFLAHTPGNPELPTLPDPSDPKGGLLSEFGDIAGITTGQPEINLLVESAAAPGTALGFAQTWLNGVGAFPVPMDFGSITADTQREITLHNTNRVAVDVTAINFTDVPGATLVSPSLTVSIPAFSSQTFVIQVTETGVEEFDGTGTFSTSDGDVSFRMIGQRVLLFPVHPEVQLFEQLSFKTSLLRSRNATEQANALRITERRTLRMKMSLDDDEERTKLHAIILGGSPSLVFSVPQFQEAREVSSAVLSTDTTIPVDTTASTFSAGGKIHCRLPDDTVVNADIQTVNPTSLELVNAIGTALPLRTFVMPSYTGRATRMPNLSIYPVNLEDMVVEFTFWDTPSIGALPSLLAVSHPTDSLPILTVPNAMRSRTKRGTLRRNDDKVDNETGPIFVSGTEPIGEFGSRFESTARSIEEIYAWRQLVHYLNGSWGRIYIPTYQNDLPAAVALGAGATLIDVPNMGIARFLNARAPRRDIRVEHPEGVEYTRITSVTDNGATERLQIAPSLTNVSAVDPGDLMVSWLNLSRIVGDVINLRHPYIGNAEISFNYRTTTE